MNMRDLLARRAAIAAEMRAINDAPAGEGGDLSAEQRAAWDGLKSDLDVLEARIGRQAAVDDAERRAAGTPISAGGGSAPGAPEVRVFSGPATPAPTGFDGTVLRGQNGERVPVLEHRHRLADFVPASESRAAELGVGGFFRALWQGASSDLERRVMAEASVGAGGALVPAPLSAQVIDLARARSVAFRAGARTIPMASQTLRFAQIIDYPEGAWRNENAPIVEDTPGLDAVTLTARSWGLIIRCSRELLEDGQNTDEAIRAMLGSSAALALDGAILAGSGVAPQPRGILNTSGVTAISMGTNGAALDDAAPLLAAVTALETANEGDISAMVMHPRTSGNLYGLTDTAGQPLNLPPRIAGIPVLTTTALPVNLTQGTAVNASPIILGDWSQVFVGMRTQLQVSVLNERYADVGQVAFLAWMRADVALARPGAMAVISGVIAP